MKLEVHFYGNSQVCIVIDPNGLQTTPDDDLTLFAWFALRQFHNLGRRLDADVFAGLLMSGFTLEPPGKLRAKDIPPATELLNKALLINWMKAEIGGPKEVAQRALNDFQVQNALNKSLSRTDPFLDAIDHHFLSMLPEIVDYQGKPGTKRFIGKLPPGTLDLKGLGILTWHLNYYVCHSIIAFSRYLGQKYAHNVATLSRLSFVAESCGIAHMQNAITYLNQQELASQIVLKSR